MATPNNEGLKYFWSTIKLSSISIIRKDQAGSEFFSAYQVAANQHPWIKDLINDWGMELKKLNLVHCSECVICGSPLHDALVTIANDRDNPYKMPVKICDVCEAPYINYFNPEIQGKEGKILIFGSPAMPVSLMSESVIAVIRSWLSANNTTIMDLVDTHPLFGEFEKLLTEIHNGNYSTERNEHEDNSKSGDNDGAEDNGDSKNLEHGTSVLLNSGVARTNQAETVIFVS